MSPEQLRDSKSVDHRCDIWALGVVAYELLTGKPPFVADNVVALFAAIQESEPTSMRGLRADAAVDVNLDAAVLKCLRRAPWDRFSSVTELASCFVPFATFVGARAFENAKRILPLADAFHDAVESPAVLASNPQVDPNPRVPAEPLQAHRIETGRALVNSTLPTVPRLAPQLLPTVPVEKQANTVDPWSRSRSGAAPMPVMAPTPKGRRVAAGIGLGVAAAIAAGGLIVGVLLWPAHSPVDSAAAKPGIASGTSETAPPSASAVTSVATSAAVAGAAPLPANLAPASVPSATLGPSSPRI